MKKKYYRFVVGDKGIYDVVYLIDPERKSPLREDKPDGSWLPKVREKYPGAISFWTEEGLRKYYESGLMEWHKKFVDKPVEVLIGTNAKNILYEDDLQIICNSSDIKITEKLGYEDLEKRISKLEYSQKN